MHHILGYFPKITVYHKGNYKCTYSSLYDLPGRVGYILATPVWILDLQL